MGQSSSAPVAAAGADDGLLFHIFDCCRRSRDAYFLARVCRRFRRLIVGLMDRPRLPQPARVAFSRSLLKYVLTQAGQSGLELFASASEGLEPILQADDDCALVNLAELMGGKFVPSDMMVLSAVAREAPRCLRCLLSRGDTLGAPLSETILIEALRLPSPHCYRVLEEFGKASLGELRNAADVAKLGGPERLCLVRGASLEEAFGGSVRRGDLAEAAVYVDDVGTLAAAEELLEKAGCVPPFLHWVKVSVAAGAPHCLRYLLAHHSAELADAATVDRCHGRVGQLGALWSAVNKRRLPAVIESFVIFSRWLGAAGKSVGLLDSVRESGAANPAANQVAQLLLAGADVGSAAAVDLLEVLRPRCDVDVARRAWEDCSTSRQANFLAKHGLVDAGRPGVWHIWNVSPRVMAKKARAWLRGGRPCAPELCRALVSRSPRTRLVAYQLGCRCASVGLASALKLGSAHTRGVLSRFPFIGFDRVCEILEADADDLLEVAVSCGCEMPPELAVHARRRGASRCLAYIADHPHLLEHRRTAEGGTR